MITNITETEFFNELKSVFPLLRGKIDNWQESVHFKMEVFADYTNDLIIENNITELKRCFGFQESRIELMSVELKNALTVSFCESLMLGSNSNRMDEIVELMPDNLRKHYNEYKNWYNDLTESSRK